MFLRRNSIGQPQPRSRIYISTSFPDYLPYYENLHKLQTSYRTNVLTKFFSVVANFFTRACGPHRSRPKNLQSDRVQISLSECMTSDLFVLIVDVNAMFMTSDSIDAIPIQCLMTSNDVDKGLRRSHTADNRLHGKCICRTIFH